MHEYITSYIKPTYDECIDCNKRTPHVCGRCRYCYSCHFKIERIEREQDLTTSRQYYNKKVVPQQKVEHVVKFVTYRLKSR
jgi:hypothetical protein